MIVVDCEMSGVIPEKNGIISIGAVDFCDKREFYVECRLDNDQELMIVPPFDPTGKASSVTEHVGMTEEQMRDSKKISIKEALELFFVWVSRSSDKTLAAQNYMDMMFIEFSCRKYNIVNPLGHRFVDIHSVGVAKLVELKQDIPLINGFSAAGARFLAKFVGIPEEPFPHNALNGAKYEAETLYRLLFGKNLLSEFKDFRIPDVLRK